MHTNYRPVIQRHKQELAKRLVELEILTNIVLTLARLIDSLEKELDNKLD
jgi:UDP-N-acetylglucosamine transferase subunit ALG13